MGNRGFQSVALDDVNLDLYIGWYGDEGDPTFESVNYEAAVIPACTLDKLVNAVSLSNPTFVTPSAATVVSD